MENTTSVSYTHLDVYKRQAVSLHYNQAMAEEYMQVFKKMQEDFNIETKITAEAVSYTHLQDRDSQQEHFD